MFRRTKTITNARDLLSLGMNPYQLRLNRTLLDDLICAFGEHRKEELADARVQLRSIPRHARAKWLSEAGIELNDQRSSENQILRSLLDFLPAQIEGLLDRLKVLKQQNAEFRNAFSAVSSPQHRERILLSYAGEVSPTRRDRRALKRFLNEDALNDRFVRLTGETEQAVAFALGRLGLLVSRCLSLVSQANEGSGQQRALEMKDAWSRSRLEPVCKRALIYPGDFRVSLAGLQSLSFAMQNISTEVAGTLLTDATAEFLRSACLDRSLDVWLQCEALSAVCKVAPQEALEMIRTRITEADDGDDMFVRRHAVSVLANCQRNQADYHREAAIDELLSLASEDRSAFVRQNVVVAALEAPANVGVPILESLCLRDECEKVRAGTLVGMLHHARHPAYISKMLEFVHRILNDDADEFVVRAALFVAVRWLEQSTDTHQNTSKYYQSVLVADMIRIESGERRTVPMRRWCAQARERIWMLLDVRARQLHERLSLRAKRIKPGQATRVPGRWLRDLNSDLIGRVLSVMAQDDFGYDLERSLFGWRLVRGPVFRFRFWRFWFELINRAPDKRQAFQHMIGRWSEATIRAPSQIMGELSKTKVPGEPYFVATDGSWRPFLPLVDDFISALQQNWFFRRPIRFYSSQGITEVLAPKSWFKMIRAMWTLNFGFPSLAQLRNWDDDPQNAANAYLNAIQKLGFIVRICPYGETTDRKPAVPAGTSTNHDPSVLQFFPCLALLGFSWTQIRFVAPDVRQLSREYMRYFGSAYENSLIHLVIFVSVFLLFFLVKHFLSNLAVRRARKAIPLSLGGWGTRGKSGTERLKAALVGAMGYGLVSKTTGCEAMFIQAHAFGEPLEIPLFRPYDKATIWEQANLLKLAAKLKPSVFLWECMGLTPSYVEVLSRQWTCDDLATITNTYPDHEDLQGPAGIDVATTISGFVPRKSHVITTEEEMRPLLSESCRQVGSTLRGVGWLESGLITDDVQDRFPYKEHPNNIALVAAMGDELGVSYEFSVKAMADYLVPDLGVLKVYPEAHVRKRRIEFTNGMSANERFGCMGNWTRLGFDKSHPQMEPDTWITAVINNRADRVARSRVFANIMVHDIAVDRFFLIGNNLTGLQGFVAEAWESRAEQYKLCGDSNQWNKETAQRSLAEAANVLRQPSTVEHVQASLKAMLRSCLDEATIMESIGNWNSPDGLQETLSSRQLDEAICGAIHKHQLALLQSLEQYQSFEDTISRSQGSDSESLDKQFRELARTWFMQKMITIENYEATGEEVLATIVDETPPGFLNRSMGMQNIKGTGLDFIYRFQAWDACYNACQQLKGEGLRAAEKGLQTLAAMPVIGQLCQAELLDAISIARSSSHLQRADIQAELNNLEKKVRDASSPTKTSSNSEATRLSKVKEWGLHVAEQFVDANDAVCRRRKCDRIYRELLHGRISRQAAVEKIRRINKRQKGGWLKTKK